MAIPHASKPYALKDKTERIVDNFAMLEKPTQTDLNRVKEKHRFNLVLSNTGQVRSI